MTYIWWIWTAILVLFVPINAHNILLLTRHDLDYLAQFLGLSQALSALGHSVTVIANEQEPEIAHLFKDSPIHLMYHRYPYGPATEPFDYLYSDEKYEATYVEQVLKRELTEECMKVIYSDELYERIRIRKFDIAIVDSSIFCYHIVPYKLKIPFISIGTAVYPFLMRMHPLLSVEPCLMKDDTFVSRIYRLVSGIYGEISPKLLIDESQFAHAVPDNLFYSLREVAANSSLWFIVRDPVLDCPLPTSPGVVQLGSLQPVLNDPLPKYLQEFIDSNTRGIVVIWFSQSLRNLTYRIQDKFSASIRKSGLLYLWYGMNKTMPDNVRTFVKVSPDSVLGISRTRLLITDCSTASVSKAIHHSVPLLCMPILGEHKYNAYRVFTRNIGLHLDIRRFRAQDLSEKIRSVVKGNFRAKIRKMSDVQKALPDSKTQAAFWIDHVLKFGSKHLQTSASHQSLYHHLMIDIYLAAVAVMIMLAYLVKYSIKILLRSNLSQKIAKKFEKVAWFFKTRRQEPVVKIDDDSDDDDDHPHPGHLPHFCPHHRQHSNKHTHIHHKHD